MTRAELTAIAADSSRPVLTRRAALDAVAALDLVGTRLRLDAGAATAVVPTGDDGDARRTWRQPP